MTGSSVPFPIPYQGSKRRLAPQIVRCLPRSTDRLVEPFCGSAAVSLYALATGAADTVWLNDNNEPLARLWMAIADRPDDVVRRYTELWNAQLGHERQFYDQVRDEFNVTQEPELLLYLLTRCVKASVRYNSVGEFNQSPDNRRRGSKPTRMAQHVHRASRLLSGRSQSSFLDYAEVLDKVSSEDVVYMDPPYQGVSAQPDRRYREVLGYDDFVDTLASLNDRCISCVISYDGRTGDRSYGKPLPKYLGLLHFELDAGRSTQATFLGRSSRTIESLYLSPALLERLGGPPAHLTGRPEPTATPVLFAGG